MRGRSMPFRDRAHEKAFLLEYGGVGVFVDVAAASVGLAASLLKLFLRAMLVPVTSAHATGLPPSNGYVEGSRVAMSLIALLAYAVVGQQRYTFLRGPLSVLHRAAVALAMPLTVRPGLCRYCDLIWHQRLLVINTMCVLSRAPIMSYWIGGMLASILAVLVDAADPSGSCKHSYSCLLSSLIDLAHSGLKRPQLLLEQLCQPPLVVHAVTYAAGLLVPGVALSCLEYRARKAWLQCQEQQQQQLQQVTPQASAPQSKPSSSVAASVHITKQRQQPVELQPTQQQQHQGPQEADSAVQLQSPSASNSSSSSAGVDVKNPQLSSPRNPLLYHSPNMTCVVSVNYSNLTATAHSKSSSCSTTVTPAVALPSVVAGAAAAAAPAGAFSCQQDMYRSPVECYMCSFKFKPPPGTGPDHLQQFKQQLRQNLEAELRSRFMSHAATAAPAGDNVSSAEASPLPIAPLVTQCTAFPGCYQLVFQVMVPIPTVSAATGPSSNVWSIQEQGWDLQLYAQQFLLQWPGWQLLCVQAELQLASGAAGSYVKGQEAVPILDGTTKPDARSLFTAPAAGPAMVKPTVALQRYVLSLSSATSAHLLVQQCLVQQLQQQGHQHVRVVVSRQPTGAIVSDRDYHLQHPDLDPSNSLQRPLSDSFAADPATRTDAGHYCHIDLDVAGIAKSCSKDHQQCQAFTVVVLAGHHPDELHADNKGLHSTSPGSVLSPGAVSAKTPGRTGSSLAPTQLQECGVLAQLPLLVLPPPVEEEVVWLLGRLQQLGVGAVGAHHMLLPMITSLAAVLSSVRAHEAPGNAVDSAPGSPGVLLDVLVVVLLSWFKKYNMVECASLVQSVVQQREAVVPGSSGDPGTAMTTWCEQRANNTPELGPTACGTGEQSSGKNSTAWLGSVADATDVDFTRSELASCSVAGRLASGEARSEALRDVLISLQPHIHAALGLVYF